MISGDAAVVLPEIQSKGRENQNVHHKCGVGSLADHLEREKTKTMQSLLVLAHNSPQESYDRSEPPSRELSWLER